MNTERTKEQDLKRDAILKSYESLAWHLADNKLDLLEAGMSGMTPEQLADSVRSTLEAYRRELAKLFCTRDEELAEFEALCKNANANVSPEEKTVKAWKEMSDTLKRFHAERGTAEDRQGQKPTVKEACDQMYYHTKAATAVWWSMMGTVAVFFIAGQAGYAAAAWAVCSLISGLLQNVWQGVALEIFIRRLDAEGMIEFNGYPDHISNGGWVFYAMKMITAIIALCAMLVGWV